LVGRPEEKTSFRGPGRKREDNSEMDVNEIRSQRADWIKLAQNKIQWRALVKTVIKGRGISWPAERLSACQGGLCRMC